MNIAQPGRPIARGERTAGQDRPDEPGARIAGGLGTAIVTWLFPSGHGGLIDHPDVEFDHAKADCWKLPDLCSRDRDLASVPVQGDTHSHAAARAHFSRPG
jgi:hypothetical protein